MRIHVPSVLVRALPPGVGEQYLTSTPMDAWCEFRSNPVLQLQRIFPQNLRYLSPLIAQAPPNTQQDTVGLCILHGRLIVENPLYSMISTPERCQVETPVR